MDGYEEADAAVRAIVPGVVMRYRDAGILTWALLHRMEDEVIAEALRSGEYDKDLLNMMRAIPLLGYPNDDSPASFAGHGFTPIVFGEIARVWRRVH